MRELGAGSLYMRGWTRLGLKRLVRLETNDVKQLNSRKPPWFHWKVVVSKLTLPPNTAIAGDADPLADPIGDTAELASFDAPVVLPLPLVLKVIVLATHQGGHDDPFRDGRAVDAGRRRDRDIAVRHDRMVHPVVDPRGEEVDEFEAVLLSGVR